MAAVLTINFRFWRSVRKSENPDGCWEWTAGRTSQGYGSLQWSAMKERRAHRISYILNVGDIPVGMQVLHTCDNKSCVNPRHLYLGVDRDNVRDSVLRGLMPRGERQAKAVLTDELVLEIRRLRAAGTKSRELSRVFGTTQGNICNVVKGRSWRHLL